MNLVRTALPALLALLLAACASLPARDSDVDAALTASGFDDQMAWLQQPLRPDITKGPLALMPDDWVDVVNATVAQTIQTETIRASLKDELKKNMDAGDLQRVRAFYESPTGRRVAALESGKLDSRLDSSSAADTATLDALAEATGTGKAVSRLAEHALGDAVDIALRTGCFGSTRLPLAGLLSGVVKKAQLLTLRTAVNERIRERYAALTPAEQSDYLAFAQGTPGRKFFDSRTALLLAKAEEAGKALGAQLTPRIDALCQEPR